MKKIYVLWSITILFFGCQTISNNDFKNEVDFQPFEPPVPYEQAMAKADAQANVSRRKNRDDRWA